MSLSEITIIILVILLILKPRDIPIVMKKLQGIKSYFTNFRSNILSCIIEEDDMSNEEVKQLNFYLQKIINIDGQYDGDYTLEKVKHKYKALIALNMKDSIQESSQKKENAE